MSTTDQRYMGAAASSHLQMTRRSGGDVDLLAAAGWRVGADCLGTLLLRCKQEWDTRRGQRMPSLEPAALALTNLAVLREKRIRAKRGGNAPINRNAIESRVAEALDVWIDDRRTRRRALPACTADENELGEWLLSLMDVKHSMATSRIERTLG